VDKEKRPVPPSRAFYCMKDLPASPNTIFAGEVDDLGRGGRQHRNVGGVGGRGGRGADLDPLCGRSGDQNDILALNTLGDGLNDRAGKDCFHFFLLSSV